MSTVFGFIKKAAALLIVALIVACGVGLYMAMDSFGKEGVPPVVQTSEVKGLTVALGRAYPVGSIVDGAENDASAPDSTAIEGFQDSLLSPSGSVAPQSQMPSTRNESQPGAAPGGPAAPAAPSTPSNPSSPPKVWHEPVYTTVHHDAVYESVHHDAEYTTHTEYYSVCSQCGYRVQGSIYPHQDEKRHTGFRSDVPFSEQVLVRAAYDEQVLVQAAWDEQVLVTPGYWS
jgi:hypothetical protein